MAPRKPRDPELLFEAARQAAQRLYRRYRHDSDVDLLLRVARMGLERLRRAAVRPAKRKTVTVDSYLARRPRGRATFKRA